MRPPIMRRGVESEPPTVEGKQGKGGDVQARAVKLPGREKGSRNRALQNAGGY
jgi:hypothetical protein